ncbi:MAG TPA: glycosyltransferase family 2 protein [Jatrophihabitantaceae bacterium]
MIAEVGVVIPVADEEERLPACLDALDVARACVNRGLTVRVVVVLDGCTDRSEAIARARKDIDVLTVRLGRVGAVRAAGVRRVLHDAAPQQLWIANTDADSTVPADWLSGMVALAEADADGDINGGADVVLGTVVPGPGLADAMHRRWHAQHTLRDGHRHVHGANFGIRADAYLAARGWPDVSSGEDELLAARALATGARIVRTGALPVTTSTRLIGRAPRGFSSYLRGLAG